MPFTVEDIARLTSMIAAAATDQRRWPEVLEHLRRVSGGVLTHMYGVDLDANWYLGQITAGYDLDWAPAYQDYYFDKNAWTIAISSAPTGVPLRAAEMCPTEEFEKTEFYNDWIRPQEDIMGGGAVMLVRDGSRMFMMGGNIRRKDIDRLEDDWMRLLGLITPHLEQALETSRLLAGKSLETLAHESAGGERRPAIVAINRQRLILHANPAAEAMLETGRILRRDLRGRLSFASGRAAADFGRAAHVFEAGGAFLPRTFRVTDPLSGGEHACRVSGTPASALGFLPAAVIPDPDETIMLVTLTPMPSQTSLGRVLAAQYGLPPQECRVVLRFCAGASLQEISEENRTSVHTVRNQLKSAMTRIGVSRQTDLVRVVEQARFGLT